MNQDLGNIVKAMITDINDKNFYAQKSGVTYKVLTDKEEFDLGEIVEGFAYLDKNDKPILTTDIPEITTDKFGWGTVVNARKDLGVFVDTSLANKDILVTLDDLSELRHLWPKNGDKLYLRMEVDDKDRTWGKLAEESLFEEMADQGDESLSNKDISGYVYSIHKYGTYIYTDDNYLAFVHPSEREEEPRLGKYVEGRVIGIREDGVLYASLLPRAYEVLDDDAQMIFTVISKSESKSIPYTDKSNPDDIRNYFGISKAQFKRALGRLMKKGLVEQSSGVTKLIEK